MFVHYSTISSNWIEWNCNSRCISVYVSLKRYTLLRIFLLFLVELQLIRIDPVFTCICVTECYDVTCMCIWINRFCLFVCFLLGFNTNRKAIHTLSAFLHTLIHTHTHTRLKAIVVNTQNGMNTYRFRDELRSKKQSSLCTHKK